MNFFQFEVDKAKGKKEKVITNTKGKENQKE